MIRLGLVAAVVSLAIALSAGGGGPVTVALKCPHDANCALPPSVLLRSGSDPSVVRRLPVESSKVRLDEGPGSEWEIGTDGTGFWSVPRRITIPARDATRLEVIEVEVWRTGNVRLVLKSPQGRPGELRVAVTAPPDPRSPLRIPRGTSFPCKAAEEDRWNCELPATTLDLAIRAEGYAPRYLWDVKVPPGEVLNLGDVTLRKGGSLVAWLDSALVKQLDKPVRAILRHQTAPGVSTTNVRLATPVAETTFSKKGVAHLTPLAPGRYTLEAHTEGYVPARFPVEVFEGRESTLRRTIDLLPSVSATVRVVPAVAPGGLPWYVELWRKTDFGAGLERAASGTASPEGLLAVTDQAEGPVRVIIKDARANTVANRELAISGSEAELLISLDIANVAGTVKLGDTPLARAVLWFGGTSGAEKVRADSNEEGRFTTSLPRLGEWRVDVEAPAEAVIGTATLSVDQDSDDIEIVLPPTEVSGSVRDFTGERLGGAAVMLFAGNVPLRRFSGRDGMFRFRGIPAGPVSLHATDRRTGEDSRTVDVVVPESGVVQNIDLVIQAARTLEGVVLSAGTPAVGARINAYAFVGGAAQQKRTTTDLDGTFSIEVPESAPEVILVVGSPGRTLHAFAVPMTDDPIALNLAPRGGTLRLRWPPGTLPLRLTFNDRMIPMPDVWDWARALGKPLDGDSLTVPDMAPGNYELCGGGRCVEGLLAIDGRVDLDLSRSANPGGDR